MNSLVSQRFLQDHTQKFEGLKILFHNLLGSKIQSIENEAFLLADHNPLRNALAQMENAVEEKSYLVQWLPGGSKRRELIVITDKTGRVIDGSITMKTGDQSTTIQDSKSIQEILTPWRQQLDLVLLGHESIGYIKISTAKRNNLFAIASVPIINKQNGQDILGAISLGFPVDQSMAKDLLRGSLLHVGFILDNRLVATTFGIEKTIEFSDAWDVMPREKRKEIMYKAEEIDLFDEPYLAYANPLPTYGSSRGLYIILTSLKRAYNFLDQLNRSIIGISLIMMLVALVIAYYLSKRITAPVSALADSVSQIAKGNYNVDMAIRTGDEFEVLGKEIQNMAATIEKRNQEIKNYIQQIEGWNKELESKVTERTKDLEEKNYRLRMISEELGRAYARIDDELKIVGELQKRLLPDRSFEWEGMTFRSVYIPNGRAGGDYYDYLSPSPNKLYILIADVSGHGTPAAFIMGIARAMAHTLIDQQLSPQNLLTQLNIILSKTLQSGEFITMFLGCLDLETYRFQYASAGHQPPLLLRSQSGELEELGVAHGLPLGVMNEADYDQVAIMINPGDRLLLYTDGIVEAFNEDKNPYGIERLLSLMKKTKNVSPDDLLESILEDLEEYVQHPLDIEPLEDDVTLLLIDFYAPEKSAPDTSTSISLRTDA
ncbi:MAG: SpoIIE family protein phosphatase [Candidatus Omnitrophica bacterium]|nr:SpoIIE family protein phosphatase [Candidatus Omnitrophota bacterium]